MNGHLIDMPFINDYKEEILPEEIQNRRDHFSKEYNPWSLDGRPSRYHPIDEETWQRKLFNKTKTCGMTKEYGNTTINLIL